MPLGLQPPHSNHQAAPVRAYTQLTSNRFQPHPTLLGGIIGTFQLLTLDLHGTARPRLLALQPCTQFLSDDPRVVRAVTPQ